MKALEKISRVWNALPLAFQFLTVLTGVGLVIYVISNRSFIDNLTHLLQAIPPIISFPIVLRPTSQSQEKDELKRDTSHPTPTP